MSGLPRSRGDPAFAVPAIVGRARERLFLHEELGAAREGEGRLVLIGGEAGIGKTTLVRALIDEATRHGVTILSGHCYDLAATPPYGPWLHLVSSYRPAPGWPAAPRGLEGGQLRAVPDQGALFAEVLCFLSDLGRIQPLLLVLEDLHWSDPASLELLRHLASHIQDLPILMVVTYRIDELSRGSSLAQHLPALIHATGGLRLELRGIGADEIGLLVDARWSLPPVDREHLMTYLQRRAEGNPFYTQELLRSLHESGLLNRGDRALFAEEIEQLPVPPLLQQVIESRVARLGEGTRRPLSLAAVIGHDVPLELWATVAEVGEEELYQIVEAATGASLLEAHRDGTRVAFVHALTREALYQAISPPRRRAWHRQVAEVLIHEPHPDPDAVAHHLQAAGDERAPEWLILAGERAQRGYAYFTAADRFAAAAALLEDVPGSEERRAWLLYRHARLLRFGTPEAGIEPITEAARLGQIAGNRLFAAESLYSEGLLHCYVNDFGTGLPLIVAGIDRITELTPEERERGGPETAWLADSLPELETDSAGDDPDELLVERFGLHHRRGSQPWWKAASGRLADALVEGERFDQAVSTLLNPSVLAQAAAGHCQIGVGIARATLGQPGLAHAAFEQARVWYRVLDHHAVIAFTWLEELHDVVMPYESTDLTGRYDTVRATEAALGRAGGALPLGYSSATGRLPLLVCEGRWDEADALIRDTLVPTNLYYRRPLSEARATLALARGQPDLAWDEVRRVFPEGRLVAPGDVQLLYGLFLIRVAATLSLAERDGEAARRWLAMHDAWLDWSGAVRGRADGHAGWAAWLLFAGDLSRARTEADVAVDAARDPLQPLSLFDALIMRAEIETRQHDLGAEHDLREALELALACRAPYLQAQALTGLGAFFAAIDRPAEAGEALADGRATAASLGATPLVARADSLIAARGMTPDPVRTPTVLTTREIEVLRLVADGLTDAAIGDRLFISPRTVGQHLRSIYSKLDVPSRTSATRYALENGLL